MPGVQNPHCEPCIAVKRSWMGCSPPRADPMPSTVVTMHQSAAHTGIKLRDVHRAREDMASEQCCGLRGFDRWFDAGDADQAFTAE